MNRRAFLATLGAVAVAPFVPCAAGDYFVVDKAMAARMPLGGLLGVVDSFRPFDPGPLTFGGVPWRPNDFMRRNTVYLIPRDFSSIDIEWSDSNG